MPEFEFVCDKCGRFEVFRKYEEIKDVKCPVCKGEVKRVWSPFSFSVGWRFTEKSHEIGNPDELEKNM